MQEATRKALRKLCFEILQDEDHSDIQQQIAQAQDLLRQLHIHQYELTKGGERPADNRNQMSFVEEKQPEIEKREEPKVEPQDEAPVSLNDDKVQLVEKSEPLIEKEEVPTEEKQEELPEAARLRLEDFVPTSKEPEAAPAKGDGSLNSRLAQGKLEFGLNDRLAFVKNLFAEDTQDFSRVVSQLNTFEDFEEAENFIEQMVRPEYDWSQKEEYVMRFKNRVRRRFGLEEESED